MLVLIKPSAPCAQAAAKADQVLGQLLRSCTWRDPGNLTQLFQVYVRPHLDCAQSSWSPWTKADTGASMTELTRQVSGLGSLPYEERFRQLGLSTFKGRRERGNFIKRPTRS